MATGCACGRVTGRDWSRQFTAIAEAMRSLPDCVIDGEACAHCEEGLPDFWRLRGGGEHACFFAFDLLILELLHLR
jgi:bifunctional non-homologous end joining protein LigD